MAVPQGIFLIHYEQSLTVHEQHRATSVHSGFPSATRESPVRVQHGRVAAGAMGQTGAGTFPGSLVPL